MNAAAQTWYEAALRLPEDERSELADRLWESLGTSADAEYAEAWRREIRTRLDELDTGAVAAIPREEAMRLIRGASGEHDRRLSES